MVWSRVRRSVIGSPGVLPVTHGTMILLLRSICRLYTITMTVTRGTSAQPVLLHRVFLPFIMIRYGVKGDSRSKISRKAITAAFAKSPRDDDENDYENSNTDEGKDASFQGRILQE